MQNPETTTTTTKTSTTTTSTTSGEEGVASSPLPPEEEMKQEEKEEEETDGRAASLSLGDEDDDDKIGDGKLNDDVAAGGGEEDKDDIDNRQEAKGHVNQEGAQHQQVDVTTNIGVVEEMEQDDEDGGNVVVVSSSTEGGSGGGGGVIDDHHDHVHRDSVSISNITTTKHPETKSNDTLLMDKEQDEDDEYEKEEQDDIDQHNDETTTQAGEMPLLYYTRLQGTSLRPPPRVSSSSSSGPPLPQSRNSIITEPNNNNKDTPLSAAMEETEPTSSSLLLSSSTTTAPSSSSSSSLPFTVDCTCSTMGQIRWSPDMLYVEGGTADVFFRTGRPDAVAATTISGSTTGTTTTTGTLAATAADTSTGPNLIPFGGGDMGGGLGLRPSSTSDPAQQLTTQSAGSVHRSSEEEDEAAAAAAAKLAMEQPMPVVALGFSNGTVQVLDGRYEHAVILSPSTLLQVREGTPKPRGTSFPAVVALDWDATGTCLAALDQGGMCTIWEYKLEYTWRSSSSSSNQNSGGGGGGGGAALSSGADPNNPSTTMTTTNNPGTTTTTTTTASTTARVFSSFISALTGSTVATPSTANTNVSATTATTANSSSSATTNMGSSWRMVAIQTTRIGYPSTFGPSTVLALDPAYKRHREKAALVGFGDGRLIMTKRQFLFQRRVDNVLYQQAAPTTTKSSSESGDRLGGGGGGSSDTTTGIQALVWRGSLVAWADATGIRLLDAEQLTRLAHIDPPVGARPSLYAHQLRDMKPHLCFETSSKLLVAWGDCLLQLRIQNTMVRTSPPPLSSSSTTAAAASGAPPPQQPQNMTNNDQSMVEVGGEQAAAGTTNESGGASTTTSTTTTSAGNASSNNNPTDVPPAAAPTTVVRRRTVECTMAWQLDCVACGVAPLDADHVMVLGAVVVAPTMMVDDDSQDGSMATTTTTTMVPPTKNDMELQVISRVNGHVTYADLLPLIRKAPPSSPQGTTSSSLTNKKNKKNPTAAAATPTSLQQQLPVESVSSLALLSTFHLPRMDDATEMQMESQPVVASTSFDFLYGAVDSAGVLPGASLVGAAAGVQSSVSSYYGSGGGIGAGGGGGGGVGNLSLSPQHPNRMFRDPHLRWNLNMVSFLVENNGQGSGGAGGADNPIQGVGGNKDKTTIHEDDVDDDTKSIDSDVYDFVCHPVTLQRSVGVTEPTSSNPYSSLAANSLSSLSNNKTTVPQPPKLLVVSESDAVSVRVRTIDDAIDYALIEDKPATALQRAIVHAPGLRQFTIGDVVSEYYRALLRLPSSTRDDDEDDDKGEENKFLIAADDDDGTYRRLSLRRMKLAAYSMPVLLGGDVGLWAKWIAALGSIPGSLFVVWKWIPVRGTWYSIDFHPHRVILH